LKKERKRKKLKKKYGCPTLTVCFAAPRDPLEKTKIDSGRITASKNLTYC